MDNRNNRDNRKNRLRNRFLVQLLSFMMIFSMMPGQSLMAFALPDDSATVAEETAGQPSEDQGTDGQEDVQEPEESGSDEASADRKGNAGGDDTASQDGAQLAGDPSSNDQATAGTDPATKDGAEAEDEPLRAADPVIENKADEYYKEPGGRAKTYTVTLTDDKEDTDKVYAGDEINYNVNVSMQAAATYKYDGQNSEPMFEQWKDITIYLTLPENVVPVSVKQKGIADDENPFTKVPNTGNTWKVNLKKDSRDATNSNYINFDVVTRITGNGKLAYGTVLDPASAEVAANFDVWIDRDKTQTKNYTRDILSKPTEEITLSTPDEWALYKWTNKDTEQTYTISKDKKKVTVHYFLDYGLSVGGMPEDDKNVYFRHGRVPYDGEIYLTETPKLTLKNGSTIQPLSITVTPKVSGYVYNDKSHSSADDSSGKPKPITVADGQHVRLPYAVVSAYKEWTENNIDEYAPAYSEYTVDIVYDYDEFKVWYYEDGAEKDAKALSENKAVIDYTLLGLEEKDTEGNSSTNIPRYIPPGHITIEKYIVGYSDGKAKLYDNTTELPVRGAARYEITKKNADGTTEAAVIYEKIGDSKYKRISGNEVTVDPFAPETATNGVDGKIDFYLDAGTYVIEEKDAPDNTEIRNKDEKIQEITVGEDQSAVAKFYNKEKLGEIRILKVDTNDVPLAGADFELYYDAQYTKPVKDKDGNTRTERTDKSSGYNAVFTRLPVGVTYYLKEKNAPDGYLMPEQAIEPVTVDPENPTGRVVKVTNRKNEASVRLIKYYSTVTDPNNPIPVGADEYLKFRGAFELQQSTDGLLWLTVATPNIHDEGQTDVLSVPLYDKNHNPYMYRFQETVPDGFFGVGNPGPSDRIYYSEIITPATDNKQFEMYNRKGGVIELTKVKISVDKTQGSYEELEGDKEFDLYRIAEGEPEAELVASGKTSPENGKVRFTGLESVTKDKPGKLYTYYAVEKNPDTGYTWITDSTITVKGNDIPAVKVGSFTDETGPTIRLNTYNVEQHVRIKIRKVNALNDQKLVPGAEFSISTDDGDRITLVNKTGEEYAEIDLGKIYHIEETKAPAGYYRDESIKDKDTTTWKAVVKDGKYVVVKKVGDKEVEVTDEDLTFTFDDTPYQEIRVRKKLKNENQPDTAATYLNGVTFTVYIIEDGKFVPYTTADGQEVTILADGKTTVALPEGVYYLHEGETSDVVLHPDKFPEMYQNYIDEERATYDETAGKFYFGPYTVKVPTQGGEEGDVIQDLGDIINIANIGHLVVFKELYDKDDKAVTNKSGFTMQLFKKDGTTLIPLKDPKDNTKNRTAVTNNDGKAAFIDLPVYDSDGSKIKYVVKEVYTGNQANLYYSDNKDFISTDSPAELRLGVDTSAGKVVNRQYMTVKAIKKYYDTREHQLTGLEYELEGATIALYSKNGNEYKFIRTGETNTKGEITFDKLIHSSDGFVAIEVSIPKRPEYKYMVPKTGTYLQPDAQGKFPETLSEEEVAGLSKVALTSDTKPEYTGTIYNEIPWTQIHVTKWDDLIPREKLDGADFTLYKQVLEEGTRKGELSFDESKCTVVGQYTSGTWIHNDERQPGEFQTDVLDIADNIVYWLVETRAPSGYSIIPENNYILFAKEGTDYTNITNDGHKQAVLNKNDITKYDVVDHKESGQGDGTENYAFIEFNKWMQREGTENKETLERKDFKLMPNATFRLYAVNKDTLNEVYLLDTITTGDENVPGSEQTQVTGYGVSRRMDAWKIYDTIKERYPDQLDNIITFQGRDDPSVTDPYKEDAQGKKTRVPGTFTLNAVLREISSSSKYELDTHGHYMQITFIPSRLSIGNAKYAVPDLETSSAELCNPEHEGDVRTQFDKNAAGSMAIVDYLAVDNSVVLYHFGYDPEMTKTGDTGYAKFHDDLEALREDNPGLFVSENVYFKLQKYDTKKKKWVNWSPVRNEEITGTETFRTNGDGYHFEEGLDPGEYKAIMTTAAAGYENFYKSDATAFHFTVVVSDRTQKFTTYSPSRPSITIEKKDLNNKTITDEAEFTLARVDGPAFNTQKAETTNGIAEFKDLPADTTFTLSESKAPDGYTNEYFVQLFKLQNPGFEGLVDGTGYHVSYETEDKPNGSKSIDGSNIKEKVIKNRNYTDGFSFTAPNVKTVSIELKKRDAQDTEKLLKGATFSIYYKAFDETAFDKGTIYNVPDYDSSWVKIRDDATTGKDGTILVDEDLKPGVYYIKEIKAPEGYDIDPDCDGKRIVMTGGLDINVPEKPAEYDLHTNPDKPGVLVFDDYKKVEMTVTKEVTFGSVPVRSYDFTFTLIDEAEKPVPGHPDHATGTPSGDTITKTPAVFDNLSQKKTYYLKESGHTGTEKYKIESVKVGTRVIRPETSGKFKDYYAITMPDDGTDVSVTVTNVLMEARVTILKYDGATEDHLRGAEFEVQKNVDGERVKVDGSRVVDNRDGTYTAIIPFEENKEADVFIHETKAPDPSIYGKNYTIDEGNDDIAVTDLLPGQDRTYTYKGKDSGENEYCLPNYEGIKLRIQKYGNLPGNTNKKLEGVEFQLFYRESPDEEWSSWHAAETTDNNGIAEFDVLEGYQYAVAEVNEVSGYAGIFGVYDGNTRMNIDHTSLGKKVYVLGSEFIYREEPYVFTAYNTPYLELRVKKIDKSTPKVQKPDVKFHVYEVPENLIPEDRDHYESLTENEINAIKNAASINNNFIRGETEQEKEPHYYSDRTFIQPGKTYLAEEDLAIDRDGGDYSIIKDDNRVVSYKMFTVPDVGYKDYYEVIFENIKGDVPKYLEKTVEPKRHASLTLDDAELKYTLVVTDPEQSETTNSYALDSYTLTDTGLTTTPSDATLAHEWYNIKSITIGQCTMETDHIRLLPGVEREEGYNYPIEATVTLEDFDGRKYKQDPVIVSSGSKTITPTGIGDKKIKSFSVEYSSPDFKHDTGYALGLNFKAEKIDLIADVYKQVPAEDGIINEVKKVTNKADLEIKYTPWGADGKKADQQTLTAHSEAFTDFDSVEAPVVIFDKTEPQDFPEVVDLGSKIPYRLIVTNVTEKPIDFTDPIIVDLLPQGMVIDQSSQFFKIIRKPDTIEDDVTVKVGYAGDSEYVNMAFTGTIPAKNPDDPDDESNILEVELMANVTDAVTNYGAEMKNYAFVTSKEVGVKTRDNGAGAVVIDKETGVWATDLVSKATALGCSQKRAEMLKDALGVQGTYGYLGDFQENLWVTANELVCIKDEYGPSDGGVYRTDKVAVLRNEDEDDQRTMHYRLTINNLSAVNRTNLVVMDILPTVGDKRLSNTDRDSNWSLYFADMGNVTVNEQLCDDYTVYYYYGDASSINADDMETVISEARSQCPTDWSMDKPTKDKHATAFIVAFDYDPDHETSVSDENTVVLGGNQKLQIEYTAITDQRDAEDLNKIVYTNAANDFNFGFSTFSAGSTANRAKPHDPLGSNVVEVTIAPPKVKVGGDVWIDADSNGKQDDGDQKWYLTFDIVKNLIKNDLRVTLNTSNQRDYKYSQTPTEGTINETGSDPDNYGIAHFEFDELTSAKLRDGSTDYVNWNADGTASMLIGKNPYTYNMTMDYSGSKFTKTKNIVEKRGSWIPVPNVPGTIPDDEKLDDNFAKGNSTTYQTEQFFLHPTSEPDWDMTKDNGYNLLRTLYLKKTSLASEEPIEGTEFTIYGPFEHGTGKDAELTNDKIVAKRTTDENGEITYGELYSEVDDQERETLFFFKEYVIVESAPTKGYSIDGAEADGANITKLDEGKWRLGVPATTSTDQNEKVYVRDPGNINVSVVKEWIDEGDAYGTRPESIFVDLYTNEACTEKAKHADRTEAETKELNELNKWSATWTELPKYKVVSGERKEITYYVKETGENNSELKGYNVEIVSETDGETGDQKLIISNTPESTSLDVTKRWKDTDDLAALVTAVTFRVESSTDGETWTTVKKQGEDVTLTIERKNGEKMGTATIDNLPAYDADNNPLTYRAVEISIKVNGKTLEVKDGKVGSYEVTEEHKAGSGSASDKSEITNTMIPTEFSVEKTFVDDEFSQSRDITSIKVMLQRKTGEGGWTDVKDFDLKPWNGWKHTWKDLPKLDPEGNAYEYRAIEVSYTTKKGETVVATYDSSDKTSGTAGAYKYTSRTEGSEEDGFTTYIENKPLIGSLRVSKKWKDTKRSKAPESLTVTLRAFADGKEIRLKGVVRSVTLSSSNNWADNTTWAALPVYTVDGVRITYTLTESGKGKYKAEYKINYGDGTTKAGTGETLDVNIYVDRVVDATFTNTLEPPVKTGDVSPLAAYLTLLILSAAGILAFFIRRKRSI